MTDFARLINDKNRVGKYKSAIAWKSAGTIVRILTIVIHLCRKCSLILLSRPRPKSYCTWCFRNLRVEQRRDRNWWKEDFLGIRDTVERQLLDLCNSGVKKGVKKEGFKDGIYIWVLEKLFSRIFSSLDELKHFVICYLIRKICDLRFWGKTILFDLLILKVLSAIGTLNNFSSNSCYKYKTTINL